MLSLGNNNQVVRSTKWGIYIGVKDKSLGNVGLKKTSVLWVKNIVGKVKLNGEQAGEKKDENLGDLV